MRKILSLLFFGISFLSFSQDIILKNNGVSINCKVIEVKVSEIAYKRSDDLNGPLYYILKSNVSKISFESGRIESFEYFKEKKELNDYKLEETKSLIKKIIDSSCFNRSNSYGKVNNNSQRRLMAEFEGNYLRLYQIHKPGYFWNDRPGKKIKKDLYDFSAKCEFHDISYRGHDYAYINAYIPRLINSKKDKWSSNYKFVLKIKGHKNAELLLKALIHYNKLLNK